MVKQFDLFKIDSTGNPLWLGAMETLEEAFERAKLENQQHPVPGTLFRVLDSRNGRSQLIPVEKIEPNA